MLFFRLFACSPVTFTCFIPFLSSRRLPSLAGGPQFVFHADILTSLLDYLSLAARVKRHFAKGDYTLSVRGFFFITSFVLTGLPKDQGTLRRKKTLLWFL